MVNSKRKRTSAAIFAALFLTIIVITSGCTKETSYPETTTPGATAQRGHAPAGDRGGKEGR